MNYGYRYHIARVLSWGMLAMAALGLMYVASTALDPTISGRRIFGTVVLFVGVVGGIASAFIAIHSKAKQTNHEEHIAVRMLNAYGEELRRKHIKKPPEAMSHKK